MAKLCTNCGMELARDDARFCGICGTLVTTHPKNVSLSQDEPQASSTPASLQSVPKEANKRVLREQIAQQPSAHPPKSVSEMRPAWMSRLDVQSTSRSIPERPRQVQGDDPQSSQAIWTAPGAEKDGAQGNTSSEQSRVAERATVAGPIQGRELRVKVWTDEEAEEPLEEEKGSRGGEDEIEQMPTAPLMVEERTSEKFSTSAVRDVEEIDTSPLSAPVRIDKSERADDAARESISDIDTRQMPMPVVASPRQANVANLAAQQLAIMQKEGQDSLSRAAASATVVQPPVRPSSVVSERATVKRRTDSKRMVLFGVGMLLIVVSIFGGLWLWLYRPFSVSPSTQTQQRVSDSTVGISLAYPTGWVEQRDQKTATLRLNDSSDTAQWAISKTNQSVANSTQYLKTQATQLGMTSTKGEQTVTFAGTSWQQVRGSVTQKGANYTATLLASMHNGHLFLIIQQAPQNIYADEEASVFAAIRSSLQFS